MQPQTAAVRVGLVSGVLALLAGVLLVGPVASLPVAASPVEIPWWLIAVCFALAEGVRVNLGLRHDGHSLSLMEVPLLVGLAVLSPMGLMTARLVGCGAARIAQRQLNPTKLAFNLALSAMEVSVGLLIFRSLLAGGDPLLERGWLAGGATILVLHLLGGMAVTGVIWLVEGTVHPAVLWEAATIGTFLALCTTAMGLLVLAVLWSSPGAGLPLLVVTAFMFLANRGYARLRQRHANLQMLHRFTSATARSGETRVAAAGMLAEVCEILRCESAEFVLIDQAGEVAVRIRLTDGQVVEDANLPASTPRGAAWCRRMSAEPASRHTAVSDGTCDLAAHLQDIEVRDGITAPVRLSTSEHLDGLLIAVNRVSQVETFDSEDVALFASIAHHAAVALENGRLVERLRQEADERAYQATHDSLTGLPNRALLQQRLDESLGTSEKPTAGSAVILIDLDGFKAVNDTLGHAAGDQVLQQVAERLREAVRPSDTVARLGGDEFAVVVPGVTDEDVPLRIAARIAELLAELREVDGHAVQIRASAGIAMARGDGLDSDALLEMADRAMYGAKRSGEGTRLHQPSPAAGDQHRLLLDLDSRAAVDRDGLVVPTSRPSACTTPD